MCTVGPVYCVPLVIVIQRGHVAHREVVPLTRNGRQEIARVFKCDGEKYIPGREKFAESLGRSQVDAYYTCRDVLLL